MSTAWVECWKCDECHFRWIKTEVWPERCPSRGCRKRSWNKLGAAVPASNGELAPQPSSGAAIAAQPDAALAKISSIQPVKMNPAMAKFMDQVRTEVPIEELMQPLNPCPHKEWAEDGEQYRCRLQAGHKGKCMPGERVSA